MCISPVSIFQTYIGSAYASHPIRWIESPGAAWSRSDVGTATERPVEKVDPDAGKPHSASGDVLDLSSKAQKPQELSRSESKVVYNADKTEEKKSNEASKLATQTTEKLSGGKELSQEEQQKVDKLKARDQEVRIHEMAHVLAGGAHVTSGPSYEYEVGPDGKGYAVGGSVGIDTSPVEGDPEATIEKMQTIVAAALAPAEPSGPDLKVAATARQTEAKARAELAQSQMQSEESEANEESEGENIAAYTIVKAADKAATQKAMTEKSAVETDAETSLTRSYAASSSKFAPSSAYQAQSVMALAASRFTAFA